MNTLEHFQSQIAKARADKRTLRIKGGGSKDFYGNAINPAHEVLDTRNHSGITSYEPSELVVTVRAGTPLTELEAALLEKGQYLPFEPPHFGAGSSTIGGMVASGLSGAARASVGSVRDHVLGVQIINGAGEVLHFGGTVMKNVAGYDVSRLMAGSMGTLALITEVSLKVLPIPAGDATLGFDVPQADALALLNRWRSQPLPINASAWVDARGTALGKNALFVRLRGAAAAVASASEQMTQAHGGYVLPPQNSPAVWRSANNHAMSFFTPPPADDVCLLRLSVPAATPVLDVPFALNGAQQVEWQGAQRWLWAKAGERDALQAIASKAGGHAVLFKTSQQHGDADKAGGVFQAQSAALSKINAGLRGQLDPFHVFNTRRL
jgi:glycolate oxidase FAD binding subunit